MTNPLLPAPSNSSDYPSENFQLFNTTVDSTSGVPHKLTITASGYDSFLLDYILLESSSAFISSLGIENAPSATTGSEATPSSDSRGGGKGVNVGAIAGGVVGGVILLALVGVGLLFWRRRTWESRNGRGGHSELEGDHMPTGADASWRESVATHPISPSRRPVTPSESGKLNQSSYLSLTTSFAYTMLHHRLYIHC